MRNQSLINNLYDNCPQKGRKKLDEIWARLSQINDSNSNPNSSQLNTVMWNDIIQIFSGLLKERNSL